MLNSRRHSINSLSFNSRSCLVSSVAVAAAAASSAAFDSAVGLDVPADGSPPGPTAVVAGAFGPDRGVEDEPGEVNVDAVLLWLWLLVLVVLLTGVVAALAEVAEAMVAPGGVDVSMQLNKERCTKRMHVICMQSIRIECDCMSHAFFFCFPARSLTRSSFVSILEISRVCSFLLPPRPHS